MYKCKYFKIKELVNPAFLQQFAEDQLWMFFDVRLLMAADLIREKYGPCFVNSPGVLNDAGARLQDSGTGAAYSAHKMFRALDLHISVIENKGLSKNDKIKAYNEVRAELLADQRLDYLGFEKDISWLHIDTYNRAAKLFNG